MGETVGCGDLAAAEIPHQDHIAEHAEIARRPDHAPGRVQPCAVFKVANVFARRGEDLNISIAISDHVIVSRGILLGVSHKQAASDVLNVEGSEAWGIRERNAPSQERQFTGEELQVKFSGDFC